MKLASVVRYTNMVKGLLTQNHLDVESVSITVTHKEGKPDRITIEKDQELGEVRVVINNECVWSCLEKEQGVQ